MAGPAENRLGLLVLTRKVTIWPAATSSGGPAAMPVAQLATVRGPASSTTVWPAPFVKLFFFNDTSTTEIYALALHDALPMLAVPPSSMSRTVTMALPLAFGAVV